VHTFEGRGAAFVAFAPSFPGAPRTAVQRGRSSLPCVVAGAGPTKVVVVGGGPAGFMAAIRYSCPAGPRMYVWDDVCVCVCVRL
jgi:alanine dehydrogenase